MFDVDGIKHTWKLPTKIKFFGIEKAQFALDCIPMLLCFIFCFWDIGSVIQLVVDFLHLVNTAASEVDPYEFYRWY